MGKTSKAKRGKRKKAQLAKQKRRAKKRKAKRAISTSASPPIDKMASEPTDILPFGQDHDIDAQTVRILCVLGVEDEDDADVNEDTLEVYFRYLQQHLQLPCRVTGIEDMGCFRWEEYYTFGPGSQREYDKLKKQYPSYTDTYELLGFSDEWDEEEGILVYVKRLSDEKQFILPLADLEGTEKASRNTQLLNDYVVWFVNYR